MLVALGLASCIRIEEAPCNRWHAEHFSVQIHLLPQAGLGSICGATVTATRPDGSVVQLEEAPLGHPANGICFYRGLNAEEGTFTVRAHKDGFDDMEDVLVTRKVDRCRIRGDSRVWTMCPTDGGPCEQR